MALYDQHESATEDGFVKQLGPDEKNRDLSEYGLLLALVCGRDRNEETRGSIAVRS